MKLFSWLFGKDKEADIIPATGVGRLGKLVNEGEIINLEDHARKRIAQCDAQISKFQNRMKSGLYNGETMTSLRGSIKAIKASKAHFAEQLKE